MGYRRLLGALQRAALDGRARPQNGNYTARFISHAYS